MPWKTLPNKLIVRRFTKLNNPITQTQYTILLNFAQKYKKLEF